MSASYQTIVGKDVSLAKYLLEEGEIVAVPTETVYGLAANALNVDAVAGIFTVKNRPLHNPLIVHARNKEAVQDLVEEIPPVAQPLLDNLMPGPLTLLLPRKASIPDIVTAGRDEVAIRIPAHPLMQSLLEQLEFPLAAPSANLFGYISPTSPEHVLKQLNGKIPYILDGGNCRAGIESTIVGFRDNVPVVYRTGYVTVADIEKLTGPVLYHTEVSLRPVAPGMMESHYAPVTPLYVTDDPEHMLMQFSSKKAGYIGFSNRSRLIPDERQIVLSTKGDLQQAAASLYAAMHKMDEGGYELIIVEKLPDTGIGKAMNDRLHKACVNKK